MLQVASQGTSALKVRGEDIFKCVGLHLFEFVHFLFCFLSTREISLWAPGDRGWELGRKLVTSIVLACTSKAGCTRPGAYMGHWDKTLGTPGRFTVASKKQETQPLSSRRTVQSSADIPVLSPVHPSRVWDPIRASLLSVSIRLSVHSCPGPGLCPHPDPLLPPRLRPALAWVGSGMGWGVCSAHSWDPAAPLGR